MKYSNIATILNNQLVTNAIGQSTTVAEDLSNIIEFGTSIANLTADQVKNFTKAVIAGVYNYVINREIETGNFKLLRDEQTYGGCLQRIMNKQMQAAEDSYLLNPQPNVNYWDGQWYGPDIDSKVYEQTKAFKTIISLGEDALNQYFKSAEEVSKLFALIENNERNTVRYQLFQLEKRIIVMLAAGAVNNSRYLPLVTLFNQKVLGVASSSDPNWKTYADIKADRDLAAYFQSFAKECVMRLKDALKDVNTKYNDGTVETWCRDDDIKAVFISEFLNDMEFLGSPIQFHERALNLEYETITAWQNPGTDMLPDLATCTTILLDNGSDPDIQIDDVVGVLYDVEGAGVTIRANKTVAEGPVPEGFVNYHHHLAANYYVDERLSSVAITLG